MKKNKTAFSVIGFLFGSALIIIAILTGSQYGKLLSGAFYGIGSATAALGLGAILRQIFVPDKKASELARKKKIAITDERNLMILGKSAIMVNKIMVYIITAFIMLLSFSGVQTWLILTAVLLLLIQTCLSVFYTDYYDKRF